MALHKYRPNKFLTMNQGYIVPVGVIEALPGDNMRHKVSALIRSQPLVAPQLTSIEVKVHSWFVPMRLISEDWEDFITGGRDGRDASVMPTITFEDGVETGSLADHLGVPPGFENLTVSALPFRAYNLIYNEFYRDQDLQDELPIALDGGDDTETSTDLVRACWDKDYFTQARANTQKGDDVNIPLSGDAPVMGIGVANNAVARNVNWDGQAAPSSRPSWNAGDLSVTAETIGAPGASNAYQVYADLSDVSAVSINDLRLATKLQVYRENMLRHGSRYVERLMAGFNVRPQDARLQLPEYLGGGKQLIQISEVLQTAEGTAPVGEMAGHGIGAMGSNRYARFIPEYGFIVTVMIIRPKTSYAQGIHRMFLRKTKEDYFQPELQHIGMQGIYNQEVYAGHAEPTGIFGFNDRYDDYRYMYDQFAGEMRNTLDFWHSGRKFPSAPALNSEFVECSGVARPFATDADQYIVRVKHDITRRSVLDASGRPMVF